MKNIIQNLEERLKPVPKNRRLMLKRAQKLDQKLRACIKCPLYEEEEMERNYAMSLNMHACIEELLLEKRNMDVFYGTREFIYKEAQNMINEENLQTIIAEEIIEIVQGMIGVTAEKPGIIQDKSLHRGAKYIVLKQEICIGTNFKFGELPEAIAHEYAHHIELSSRAQMQWMRYIALMEGFAYMAGINAAKEYSHRKKTQAPRWFALRHAADILHTAESFLEMKNAMCAYKPDRNRFINYGITAFLVAEAKHGKSIYREIIRSAEPAEYLIKKLK